ncbi:MAG: alpha-keto acid decarboxylase family protein [Planctomycetes bacterium]|nr:alpha-keto acid decarboxylase family protein [Planctomycetota bacterium]
MDKNTHAKHASDHGKGRRDVSIGQYLINRLEDYGIRDCFGIPGDYVLNFYSMLEESDINVVGCTREDCAGFAADAYARIRGMGALCVTYCVGGLSVCNSVAGAFAEKSPVVVLTGSPGLKERVNNPLLHHKVRDFSTQREVFEKLCIAATELDDPATAFSEIDRVLDACYRFKRPVYIELPRDMVDVVPPIAHAYRRPALSYDHLALDEAVREVIERLNRAERPLIVAGVEIHRFGLQDQVIRLAEQAGIPIAATILGKSVVDETHPLFVGLYEGAMGREEVTHYVEDSDCVLLLGTFMTDINLGIYTAKLDVRNCIYATSEQLQISYHQYPNVPLNEFIEKIIAANPSPTRRHIPDDLHLKKPQVFQVDSERGLSVTRIMERINTQIDAETIVIADIGDSLFASSELVIHERTDFLSPAYYTSMGFSVPAALGACVAKPKDRVLVIAGDGAFQMTGQEMSSLIRLGYSPIIIVLDNHGYGTERFLQKGTWKYNEIAIWNYSKLPEVYGGGKGHLVSNEREFDAALTEAWADRSQLHLIHVKLIENDASRSLLRLAERLGLRV